MKKKLYKRHIEEQLLSALKVSPVILVQGPRQCGKTTLAQWLGENSPHQYKYISFDSSVQQELANTDPVGLIENLPEHVILDEVQRVPKLFAQIKLSVDTNRKPGRFILTGSAMIFGLPNLGDSLAGRMFIFDLCPLSQCELEEKAPTFLEAAFSPKFKNQNFPSSTKEPLERIIAGGYPSALEMKEPKKRAGWYSNFVRTLVQRDAQDISNIKRPETLRGLLTIASEQTAQLLKLSTLLDALDITRPTLESYLTILENLYLIQRIPSWYKGEMKRRSHAHKLHMLDTGIACAMLKLKAIDFENNRTKFGHLFESFVLQELIKQSKYYGEDEFSFLHYKEHNESEVDIVIERGYREVVGIEVKATHTPSEEHFKGLKKLQEVIKGDRFKGGFLIYLGDRILPYSDKLCAIPVHMLWEDLK